MQNGNSLQTLQGYPALLRSKFPDALTLTAELSVPRMLEIRKRNGITKLSDCVRGNFPTLKDVELSHGEVAAVGMIRMHLIALNKSMNQNRMTKEQIAEAAQLMYEEAWFLKLTELYEFFVLVKKGGYGEYYGSLDVLKIMADLRLFLKDRAEAVRRIEAERNRRKRNEEWDRRQKEWENAHPDNV